MELKHLSLILGLTKSELKKRLELGQLDIELLNRQISERAEELKLDALLESMNIDWEEDRLKIKLTESSDTLG